MKPMSEAKPKTIQIFLPSGEPTGIRVAEITTRIVQVIEVPRKRLPEFFAMPESTQVGVYFLLAVPRRASSYLSPESCSYLLLSISS